LEQLATNFVNVQYLILLLFNLN